jgi:hypothetical protein
MAKQYVKPRMWKETERNFKIKIRNMNVDLKNMGINKKVKMTRFLHALSLTPFSPSDVGITLRQLSNGRRKL